MKEFDINIKIKDFKKLRIVRTFFLLLFVLFLSFFQNVSKSLAADGINHQLGYYGVLKYSNGENAADGNYDMVFRIYTTSSGGMAIWTGSYTAANGNSVEINNGNFTVLLGSGSGNALNIDFNQDEYYVGVTVGTDSEMSPRQRIGAAAYSFNADTVDGVNIATVTSTPEGSVTGSVGDMALDTTAGKIYIKTSGTDNNTGWSEIVGSGGITTFSGLTDSTISSPSSGNILVYDGTDSWDNKTLTGDASINSSGVLTINPNSVSLGTDTTGSYVATIADAGSGDITVNNSGTENASVTLDIADDALDFTELSDTLVVDATTAFDMDTNSADFNFDSNTLFIDSSANQIGIGTSTPGSKLDVAGDVRILAQGDLRLADADSSAYLAFQAPGNVTSDVVWTLPSADGNNGQVLMTNGGGILSWNTIFTTNLDDNVNDALDIQEGSNDYINVRTVNGSESVAFGNSTTNPAFQFLGSGTTTLSGDLAVNGGDITTTTTTANMLNANATTLNIGGDATAVDIASTTGTTSVNNALAVDGSVTLGDAATDTITANGVWQNLNALVFEGATDNAFETTFAITDPTADRTVTFQDGSGTVAFTSDLGPTTLAGLGDTTLASLAAGNLLIYDGSDSWDNKVLGGDATINSSGALTISADAVALGTDTTGNYVTSITTGSGISGGDGGSEGAALTLALNIDGLSAISTPDNDDTLAVYDSSGTAIRKISRSNFLSGITGALVYQGAWNATTNSPALSDLGGSQGQYYVTSTAGSRDLGSGSITFDIGDWVVHNGSVWEKLDSSNDVQSVFGRTGTITASNGDYTAAQITNVAAGNIASTTVQAAIDELDTEKQPLDAQLTDVAGLTPSDGSLIIGDGTNFIAESGDTARTSLGLGTGNSPTFAGLSLSSGASTGLAMTRSSAGQWFSMNDGTDTFGVYNISGTPEGNIAANIGSLTIDTNNGDLYIKTTDTVNTGWIAFGSASGNNFQQTYTQGGSVTTTNAKDIDFILADTTTDSNFDIDIADGSTSTVSISRENGIGTSDPAQLLLLENLDTDRVIAAGLKISAAAGGLTSALDLTDADIVNALSVGANTILGTTGNIDFTNFDIAGATGNITTAGTLAINGDAITSDGTTLTINATGNVDIQDNLTADSLTLDTGDLTFENNIVITNDSSSTLAFTDGTNTLLSIVDGGTTGNVTATGTLTAFGGAITSGSNGTDGALVIYSEQGVTDYSYTLSPHAAATQNVALTLPANDGDAGQFLQSDGSGAMSWADALISALTDNSADALDIQEGTNNYINIDTTNNSEVMAFGNTIINPEFNFLGTGKVGINTTKPNGKLHVVGEQQVDITTINSERPGLIIEQQHGSAHGPMLEFRMNNGTERWTNAAIASIDNSNFSGELSFFTQPGGTTDPTDERNRGADLVERMRLNKDGELGLATTDPGTLLQLGPIGTTAGSTGELSFRELSGDEYVGFKAPDAITDNVTWTLPGADGTSGQALTTDASGILGWSDVSSTLAGLNDTTVSTPTSGNILIWDGTDSWDNRALSGDATLSNTGIITIAANAVALATDTTGNYVATIADGGSGDITVANSGTENAAVTLDIVDDALDFTELADTMTLDTTTTISMGTNDLNFDSNTFFIDSSENRIGIGTNSPNAKLDIIGPTQGDPATLNSEVPGMIIEQRYNLTDGNAYGPMLEFRMNDSNDQVWSNAAIVGLDHGSFSGELAFFTQPGGSNSPTDRRNNGAALVENMRLNKDGELGIKTTDPTTLLQLGPIGTTAGNTGVLSFRELSGDEYVGFKAPDAITTSQTWVLPSADGTSGQALITDADGVLSWDYAAIQDDSLDFSEFADSMSLDAATDVNLGANDLEFDLNGTGNFKIVDGSTTAFFVDDETNNEVGIGTNDPNAKLDIIGPTQGTVTAIGSEVPGLIIQQRHAPSGTVYGPMLEFRMSNATDAWTNGAIVGVDNGSFSGELAFLTQAGGSTNPADRRSGGTSLVEQMRLNKSGELGIKTTDPTTLLQLGPIGTTAGSTGALSFRELSGDEYVGFKAPDAITSNQIWVLPSADGTSGQALITNGSNTLSWGSATVEDDSLDFTEFADSMTLDAATTITSGANNFTINLNSTGDFVIQDNGTNALAVTDSGGVTIGANDNTVGTVALMGGGTGNHEGGELQFYMAADYDLNTSESGEYVWLDVYDDDFRMGFAGTGGEALRVKSNGNLGISTTDPGTLLQLGPFGTSSGQTGELSFRELSGNEYVGFKAPDAITASHTWVLPGADGTNGQALTTNGGGTLGWSSIIASDLTDNTADALDIQEGANNYINVSTADGSEAVAFGNTTTDPTFSFLGSGTVNVGDSIFSNTNAVMRLSSASNPHLILEDVGNSVGGLANATNDLILASQSGSFVFRTGVAADGDWSTTGTERLKIESGGNAIFNQRIGTGGTSPDAALHIKGNGYPAGFVRLESNSATEDTGIRFYANNTTKAHFYHDGDAFTSQLRLSYEGGGELNFIDSGVIQLHAASDQQLSLQGSRVGINNGTNNAILEFQESGVGRYQIAVDNSNDHLQIVNANGVVQMHTEQGHTDWHANSDSRLKENIQEITVLDDLDNYRAVSFNWKDSGRDTIGVIAQELYEVFPEFVSVGASMDEELLADRSNAWSVTYASLAPVALQGVKELAAISDDHALSIDQLTQSVDSHSMRLEAVGSEGDLSLDQLKTNVSDLLARVVELEEKYQTLDSELQTILENQIQSEINQDTLRLDQLAQLVQDGKVLQFTDGVEFAGGVTFKKPVAFSSDQVGSLTIPEGKTRVRVTFTQSFSEIPLINLTPVESIYASYSITDVTNEGFTVKVSPSEDQDLIFNWTAFMASGEKASVEVLSDEEEENINDLDESEKEIVNEEVDEEEVDLEPESVNDADEEVSEVETVDEAEEGATEPEETETSEEQSTKEENLEISQEEEVS